ncbi:hypothetical protein P3T73_14440 [Kiritimatiellota bacterium B12222]|nr:hypothetical protein P3T73_14440 [Kiritimatiellota bacterium B12222]
MNTKQILRCALVPLITASTMASASIIFEENFNDDTATGFSDPYDIYTPASQVYTVTTGGTGVIGNNVIGPSVAEVGSLTGTDFNLTSSFKILNGTGKGTLGFATFGNDSDLSGSYYQAYISRPGTAGSLDISMVLEEVGGDGLINSSSTATLTSIEDTTLLFTLSGIYDGGNLSLSFNVTGGGINKTISGIDTTPLTGEYFGYRTTRAGGPTNVEMDNFLIVSIPEPNSITLLCLGALSILLVKNTRKRRR